MQKNQIEEMAKIIHGYCEAECLDGCYSCVPYKKAEALFNAGYRKQEWISVEDALPTEQKDFLVCYGFDRGDGDLGMMFTGVLTYFAYDKKPHFQHEKSSVGLRVTHWMPLPEPPKGE